MNTKRALFSALIFLTTILACAVPGISSVSQPAPTSDSGRLETMVAETVSAAIALTEQAPAPTSPPTPKPTITPTHEVGESGSTLTAQEDGNTLLFTDERAGYQIVIPAGWLAVRINEQEYYDVWGLGAAADPNIQKTLLSVQNEDPNIFRLLGIDVQDGHLQGDIVTTLNFIWDEKTNLSLDTEDDLQAIADNLTKSTPGLEVTSVSFVISPTDMQFGVIEAQKKAANGSDQEVTLYQKMVFFNAKTGSQNITLTTSTALMEAVLPQFDAMLETIKVNAE